MIVAGFGQNVPTDIHHERTYRPPRAPYIRLPALSQ